MRKWLADRLEELKTRGKSRSGLARHMQLSPPRITEIIAGTRGIDGAEVAKIAEYLEWPDSAVLAQLKDKAGGGGLAEEQAAYANLNVDVRSTRAILNGLCRPLIRLAVTANQHCT